VRRRIVRAIGVPWVGSAGTWRAAASLDCMFLGFHRRDFDRQRSSAGCTRTCYYKRHQIDAYSEHLAVLTTSTWRLLEYVTASRAAA